jgi:transposase
MLKLKDMHVGYSQHTIGGKKCRYYNLSKSIRKGKKVGKKVELQLGRLSEEEVGQMRMLVQAAKGKLPENLSLEKVDPFRSVSCLELAVAAAIWDEWNMSKAFTISVTKGELSTSLIAKILTINRCIKPHSHYSIPNWVNETAIPEMFSLGLNKLNDDKLYHELDKIHNNKESLESFLFQATYNRDPASYEFVNYDLSTSYFVGIKCNLSRFGRSKDDKGASRRQVILALMVNDKGYPFKWDVLPGDTAEVKTLEDNINACIHRFGLKKISLVFDRGIVSDDNLELVDQASLKYISALDKSQIPGIAGKELNVFSSLRSGADIEQLSEFEKFDHRLYFKDIGIINDKRYLLGLNPELFTEERKLRQEKLNLFKDFLKTKNRELKQAKKDRKEDVTKRAITDKLKRLKITRSLFKEIELERIKVKRRLKNGILKTVKSFHIRLPLNHKKLRMRRLLDGVCLFVTNHTEKEGKDFIFSAEKIIMAYRHKTQIEDAFKNIKSFLKIRPFHVNLDEHVEAVYTICVLSYFINKDLARRRKEYEQKDFLNSRELYAPFTSCKLVTLKNILTGETRKKIIPLERHQISLLKNIGLGHLTSPKATTNLFGATPM